MPYYISQASMNPISRVFAALVAALALVGAFFFGLVILALFVGLGLLLGLGFWLRMWWVRRHLPREETKADTGSVQGEIIDAEYTVVSRRRD